MSSPGWPEVNLQFPNLLFQCQNILIPPMSNMTLLNRYWLVSVGLDDTDILPADAPTLTKAEECKLWVLGKCYKCMAIVCCEYWPSTRQTGRDGVGMQKAVGASADIVQGNKTIFPRC